MDTNTCNCRLGITPSSVGDGLCHDEANNADCNYDGGDCCLININTKYCSECSCFLQDTCAAGFHPLVGNSFCNDETNIPECGYDGSDCCKSPVDTSRCSHCKCIGKLDTLY